MIVHGAQVPALVMYRKETGYTLALAFLPELRATHLKYEKATQRLRSAIRNDLKDMTTARPDLDRVLWATFAPECRLQFEPIEFESGSLRVNGLLAVLHFKLGDHKYLCLPMLDALLIAVDDADEAERAEHIATHAQAFFREQRKKQGEGFDPERYLSQRSDTCVTLDFTLNVNGPSFPFEPYDRGFAGRRGGQSFEGRTELPRVAQDLNERYPDELMQAVLREEWVAELTELLYQETPGCIALVGPSGCGKTAVLHETLRRHIAATGKRDLGRVQKMWHMDPLRVISGMSIVGQWQRRTEAIVSYLTERLKEAYSIEKPDHLVCDNMVALFRIGKSSQNSLTLADALRPHLERRAFTLIAEATPEEWQKVQEYDRRFAELFRVIRLPAAAPRDALRMVAWQRARLEQQHACVIDGAAVEELLKLTQRFFATEVMPGPAARALAQLAARHEKGTAGVPEVRALFQGSHHFREKLFARDQVFAPGEVEDFFAARLIGQAAARACLADVAYLIKSGLARPGKPLASLLFIGPTGVGKTEAAKVLAEMLFGDDPGGLMRFDMNEFVDASAIARLIGDKQRPDGQLTNAVRQRKACVVLLDEIEKADPAVHDLLLQVLGEGRLTDAVGRTTDFSQCVVVMTSNLGAADAARVTGFMPASDSAPSYREAVTRFFRPEFLNRIDRQVAFSHLNRVELTQVAHLHIGRLLTRDGFVRRMTFLNVDEATVGALAASGYDPQFGARALKRHIERLLTGPTAAKLATEAGDKPMILDVFSDSGVLKSRATMLDYAPATGETLPMLQGSALAAYQALQARVSAHQSALWAVLDSTNPPHVFELRSLQDRLHRLKARIDNRCWALEERRPTASRGRPAPRSLHHDWFVVKHSILSESAPKRVMLSERIAQSELATYLDDMTTWTERLSEDDPYYLDTVLDLHFWEAQFRALGERGVDVVCVEIVSHRPVEAGYFEKVWTGYAGLFVYLDAAFLTPQPLRREGLAAEYHVLSGPGLVDILAREAGVHVWRVDQAQAMPLSVHVGRLDEPANALAQAAAQRAYDREAGPGPIVRLYHETRTPYQFVVTDLRSARVRKSTEALNAEDWKLLLYLPSALH